MLLDRHRIGHIVIVSGKTGALLTKLTTPNATEIYYTPQILNMTNGEMVLFGTGSPSSPGTLNIVSLKNLTSGNMVRNLFLF